MRRTYGAFVAGALALAVSSAAFAAEQVGRVSGSFGQVMVDGQRADVNTPLENGDRIVTGRNDAAAVLLDNKTVVKMDGDTVLRVVENGGQTNLQLEKGTVQVFLGKRDGNLGPVALTDPDATIEAIGTIYVASYNPNDRSGFYAAQENRIRIRGGLGLNRGATTQPVQQAQGDTTELDQGQQARFRNGQLIDKGPIDPQEMDSRTDNIDALDRSQLRRSAGLANERVALADLRNNLPAGQGGGGLGIGTPGFDRPRDELADAQTINKVAQALASPAAGPVTVTQPPTQTLPQVSGVLDQGNVLRFSVVDNGAQDGDRVRIRVFSPTQVFLVVPDHTLLNAGTTFTPTVTPGRVNIEFLALNEGSASPNTAGINILNQVTQGNPSTSYNLQTGQSALLPLQMVAPSQGGGVVVNNGQ